MKQLALDLPQFGNVQNTPGFNVNGNPSPTMGEVVSAGLEIGIYMAAFLMLFWVFWGVYQYIISEGNKEALAKARTRIRWAIVGFIMALLALSVSQYFQYYAFPDANQFNLTRDPAPISQPTVTQKTCQDSGGIWDSGTNTCK
jgi:hypothetical protein